MTSDATGVVDTIRDIAANEGGGALYAGSTALRTTFTTHDLLPATTTCRQRATYDSLHTSAAYDLLLTIYVSLLSTDYLPTYLTTYHLLLITGALHARTALLATTTLPT
jgi:hypothetical protein